MQNSIFFYMLAKIPNPCQLHERESSVTLKWTKMIGIRKWLGCENPTKSWEGRGFLQTIYRFCNIDVNTIVSSSENIIL